jgi:pyridoxamine 5'-phosphate oxidase
MPDPNPFEHFRRWYDQARAAPIDKPHAMTLSTVDEAGKPSCRVVLLSSYDERGFVFHTNYESRKGVDIARNPQVALTFWWDPLGYQVRIEGRAQKRSAPESDAYFANRPRGNQLSAWASEQSRYIDSYEELVERMRRLEQEYADKPVPRPPHWGGYLIVPQSFEFWESREDRLHERQHYERTEEGGWRRILLAP